MALTSQMKRRVAVMVAHHIPHETKGPGREPGWPTLNCKEEEPCLETVAITCQVKKKEALMLAHTHTQSGGKEEWQCWWLTTYPMKPGALGGTWVA